MQRQIISSDGPLEERFGYSRAVRVGCHAFIAGTTALGPDGVIGAGDAERQAKVCFQKIAAALEACGMTMQDITRTRVSGEYCGR